MGKRQTPQEFRNTSLEGTHKIKADNKSSINDVVRYLRTYSDNHAAQANEKPETASFTLSNRERQAPSRIGIGPEHALRNDQTIQVRMQPFVHYQSFKVRDLNLSTDASRSLTLFDETKLGPLDAQQARLYSNILEGVKKDGLSSGTQPMTTKEKSQAIIFSQSKVLGSFNQRQMNALNAYTYRYDRAINDYCRTGQSRDQKAVEYADQLDGMIEQAKLPSSLVLRKDLSLDRFSTSIEGQKTANVASWVGKRMLDKAFFSTSVDLEGRYDPAFKGGQPVVRMFIHVPEGAKGLSLQGFSMHQTEHEILLPRNTRLHIDKITPFRREQSSLQYLPDYVVHASLVHGETLPRTMWPATSSSYTPFETQSIQNIQHQFYQEVPQQQVDTGAAQKEVEWNAKNQGRLFVHKVSGGPYLVTTMSDYQRTMGADGTGITNYKEITRGPDRERLKNQWQRQLSMPIPDTYRQLLNTILDTIAQREQVGL